MSSKDTIGDCPFCAIGSGRDRSVEIVCQEEDWIAFFPLNPATPGHTLVIPRIHIPDLWAADPRVGAELTTGVIRVGTAINQALRPEGLNLISSAGTAAEQSVFHLHLHVVPRWPKDGFGRIWPPSRRYEDESLEDVGERIRLACAEN